MLKPMKWTHIICVQMVKMTSKVQSYFVVLPPLKSLLFNFSLLHECHRNISKWIHELLMWCLEVKCKDLIKLWVFAYTLQIIKWLIGNMPPLTTSTGIFKDGKMSNMFLSINPTLRMSRCTYFRVHGTSFPVLLFCWLHYR